MLRKFPSLYLLLFSIAGILLADRLHWSGGWFLFGVAVTTLVALWMLVQKRAALSSLLCGIALAGFCGFHLSQKLYDVGPYHVSNFADGESTYLIWGTVRDWPIMKLDRTEFVIAVDSLEDKKSVRAEGNILLSVSDTTTELQRGDRIELRGAIYPIRGRGTPWGFNYTRYINLKGIFGTVYATTLIDVRVDRRSPYALVPLVDRLRSAIRDALQATLAPEPAAIAAGFLIGETRNISPELYRHFRDSGTLHLLAVSGSNVGLIVFFALSILWLFPLSRRWRAALLLLVLIVYSVLAYLEPSVVRASLMAGLLLLAGILERRVDLNNVVATAAVIILLLDPTQLFDAGTQMSFLIAWGLVIAMPRLQELFRKLHRRWWYRWVGMPLMVTIVAQVFALPILAYYYDQVNLTGFLSNILIIPLVSVAVIGVMILLIAYLILPALGLMVGSLLTLLLQWTVDLVHYFATELNWIIAIEKTGPWVVLALYLLLVLAAFGILSRRMRIRVVMWGILFLNLYFMVRVVSALTEDHAPALTLFTIPGGVAGLVTETGSNEADLIVSGLNRRDYDIGERVIRPALTYEKITKLRHLILTDAEFEAVDDIARLASAYRADTILVNSTLLAGGIDAVHEAGLDKSLVVVSLGNGEDENSGYSSAEQGIRLRLDSGDIIFNRRLERAVVAIKEQRHSILVLSTGTPLERTGLKDLLESGVDYLVCPYLAQDTSSAAIGEFRQIIPLFRDGWCRFNLNRLDRTD